MDPSSLLAPLLPYLLQGGVELAKSAAGELGKKLSAVCTRTACDVKCS